MSFYISDIFPYLNKECQKRLEIQLGTILRYQSKQKDIKSHIVQFFKNNYADNLKKILISKKNDVIKQMFLEGGFIEKFKVTYYPLDFPLIEINDYYYLPLELYEAIYTDDFLKEQRFILGLLNYLTEKELQYWKKWLEKETQIPYKSYLPLKKNLIPFYFYILLSPITISSMDLIKKEKYSLKECFHELLNHHPLNLLNECFCFYQVLLKLYYSPSILINFDNQKIYLKDLLLFFLSGKLMPVYKNSKIEKIVLTKELRDIEISNLEKIPIYKEKVIYFNFKKK